MTAFVFFIFKSAGEGEGWFEGEAKSAKTKRGQRSGDEIERNQRKQNEINENKTK